MSKQSASSKNTWSEVAKTCVNEDAQDRDIAFIYKDEGHTRRISIRSIVKHENKKTNVNHGFTTFLESGEGETAAAKLCATSKSVKTAILKDM